jgi:predicted phage terminase large subunit-like protein
MKKDLKDSAFAQMQQDPKPADGGLFKKEWWGSFVGYSSTILETVQFIDCAQKPGISNDFTVIATWVKTDTGYDIVDVWRGKTTGPILEATAKQKYAEFLPNAVVVEDKSAGSSLIQYLRAGTHIPVIPYEPKGDKEVRATAATPTIESGKVRLLKDAKWAKDFIEEHERFPLADHDDQVDTTSMAVDYFARRVSSQPRIRTL